MVAQQTGLEVGDFVWTGGDCHIYDNHVEQVTRAARPRAVPAARTLRAAPARRRSSTTPSTTSSSSTTSTTRPSRRRWRCDPRDARRWSGRRRAAASSGTTAPCPWHLPEDLAHFRRLTAGHRGAHGPRAPGTSLPDRFRPLPGRRERRAHRGRRPGPPTGATVVARGRRRPTPPRRTATPGSSAAARSTRPCSTPRTALEVTEIDLDVPGDAWAPRSTRRCGSPTPWTRRPAGAPRRPGCATGTSPTGAAERAARGRSGPTGAGPVDSDPCLRPRLPRGRSVRCSPRWSRPMDRRRRRRPAGGGVARAPPRRPRPRRARAQRHHRRGPDDARAREGRPPRAPSSTRSATARSSSREPAPTTPSTPSGWPSRPPRPAPTGCSSSRRTTPGRPRRASTSTPSPSRTRPTCPSCSTTSPAAPCVRYAPETLDRLAAHERIVAVKDATGRRVRGPARHAAAPGLAWYSGDDALNLAFLTHGAAGVVSMVGHLVGDRLAALVAAVDAGDLAARSRRAPSRCCPRRHRSAGPATARCGPRSLSSCSASSPAAPCGCRRSTADDDEVDVVRAAMRAAGLLAH